MHAVPHHLTQARISPKPVNIRREPANSSNPRSYRPAAILSTATGRLLVHCGKTVARSGPARPRRHAVAGIACDAFSIFVRAFAWHLRREFWHTRRHDVRQDTRAVEMKAGHGRGRQLALLRICAFLGACSGHDKPPSTVADACRMQSERPQWFAAMRKTEDKWGVPVSVQLATIARELSFRHDARPTKRVGSGMLLARGAALERLRLRPGDRRHLGRLPRATPAGAAPTATTSPTPRTSSAGT